MLRPLVAFSLSLSLFAAGLGLAACGGATQVHESADGERASSASECRTLDWPGLEAYVRPTAPKKATFLNFWATW